MLQYRGPPTPPSSPALLPQALVSSYQAPLQLTPPQTLLLIASYFQCKDYTKLLGRPECDWYLSENLTVLLVDEEFKGISEAELELQALFIFRELAKDSTSTAILPYRKVIPSRKFTRYLNLRLLSVAFGLGLLETFPVFQPDPQLLALSHLFREGLPMLRPRVRCQMGRLLVPETDELGEVIMVELNGSYLVSADSNDKFWSDLAKELLSDVVEVAAVYLSICDQFINEICEPGRDAQNEEGRPQAVQRRKLFETSPHWWSNMGF